MYLKLIIIIIISLLIFVGLFMYNKNQKTKSPFGPQADEKPPVAPPAPAPDPPAPAPAPAPPAPAPAPAPPDIVRDPCLDVAYAVANYGTCCGNGGFKNEGHGPICQEAAPIVKGNPSPIIKGQRCLKGQTFLGFDKNPKSCNAAASNNPACKDMYWVQSEGSGGGSGNRGRCYCATFPGTQMNMSNTPCFGGSGWQQNDQYNVYRIRR